MSDSDLDLPRTAAEARAIGSKHYFTNKPCKNGHLAKRVTANGVCRECLYAATRAWVTKTPGKSAAYTEAWRQRLLARVGQEEYNKIMNARAAKWRADHPTVGPGRGSTTLKTQEVLERFEAVHANRYVYHLPYTGMHDYMTIECDQHGEFQQTPHNHLKGAGCPKCAHGFSQPEEDIALYMESLGLEVIRRSRKIIPPLELDIYAPKIGLAVEFCGLYWHSSLHITDPKKLKTAHYDKFKRCEALGIRLITIYEDEWRDRQSQIKSIIKNSSTRDVGFGARSCVTSRISMNDASAFYEANHIQGAPRSGSSYGLHHNGELVAAMTFTQGGSQRGSRSWELIRYATKNSIAGGAGPQLVWDGRSRVA